MTNVATMALVSGDVGYTTLIGSVIGANLKGARLKMIACSQDRTPWHWWASRNSSP